MVLQRNTLNAAISMIVSLLGIAGIFLLLEAYLLAVLQIIVYAGAVMVLILFIVMLMDVDGQAKKPVAFLRVFLGMLAFAVLVSGGVYLLKQSDSFLRGGEITEVPQLAVPESTALPGQALTEEQRIQLQSQPAEYSSGLKSYGYLLFSKYMLPFQVVGFLLFAAMIGVIIISKKSQEEEEPEEAK